MVRVRGLKVKEVVKGVEFPGLWGPKKKKMENYQVLGQVYNEDDVWRTIYR